MRQREKAQEESKGGKEKKQRQKKTISVAGTEADNCQRDETRSRSRTQEVGCTRIECGVNE